MGWRRTSRDEGIPEWQEKYGSIRDLNPESSIERKIIVYWTVHFPRNLMFELSSSVVTYSWELRTSNIQLSSLSVVQMIRWLSFNAHALSHFLILFPRNPDPNLPQAPPSQSVVYTTLYDSQSNLKLRLERRSNERQIVAWSCKGTATHIDIQN